MTIPACNALLVAAEMQVNIGVSNDEYGTEKRGVQNEEWR